MAEANLREVLEAFDQLERHLPAEKVTAAVFDPKQVCEIYGKIRPYILVVLPWLDKIFKKVADVIRLLMGIADSFCQIPTAK